MPQKTEHRIWKIIELFYKSDLAFGRIHDEYERKVAPYCGGGTIRPEELKLDPRNLADLLEYRRLEELRDRYLWPLKEYCHSTFRGRDQTDLLDRYISDIFHEISILKEELYTVEHYAPVWARAEAYRELESIMGEAARLFPQKVHHVAFLFRTARARLENLLAAFREQKILVRSLFLNRRGFISECYPAGLEHFYGLMYGGGPLEGYLRAGLSFHESGFLSTAAEAFQEGDACARRRTEPSDEEHRFAEAIRSYALKTKERMEHAERLPADAEPAPGA